ncbi:hypothetical protein BDU57DRAFT_530641 [Ampelomyces quisqualis]|uniref:Uncharacterized protein n=1 Tax=Ampelomyces quisqualis TaxID=50730 RepID=A0A6A5QK13_AMPQU|nr:hypothetical protein BDU57DRAFT_530641 [Ampelomyces quisqualis]
MEKARLAERRDRVGRACMLGWLLAPALRWARRGTEYGSAEDAANSRQQTFRHRLRARLGRSAAVQAGIRRLFLGQTMELASLATAVDSGLGDAMLDPCRSVVPQLPQLHPTLASSSAPATMAKANASTARAPFRLLSSAR